MLSPLCITVFDLIFPAQRRSKPIAAVKWKVFRRRTARERVQMAIKGVDVPSWIGSLPHDFGTKKAGTLKAYQWRILWTIYIPLALVSLWSDSSPIQNPEVDSQPMDDVLANVMHLATALVFVYKHTTNPLRAESFRKHFAAHVAGLTALYPGFGIPSYHTTFHLYDFLLALGPVRSWWCFPFERLIGKLQRMKHNHRFGQCYLFVFPRTYIQC